MYRQSDYYKIGQLAENYGPYLKSKGCTDEEINNCQIALKVLYWQSSEQMDYLIKIIDEGITDGKQFCMVLNFAWTILDAQAKVATLAKIGDPNTDYTTKSDTHYISNIVIYPDKDGKKRKVNDFLFVRFLRSFISAHPVNSQYEDTVRGFLPASDAYCQYVDYVVNEGWYDPKKYNSADFRVAMLYDSGTEWPKDIWINSTEIWRFVRDRFDQMTDVILSALSERTGIKVEDVI